MLVGMVPIAVGPDTGSISDHADQHAVAAEDDQLRAGEFHLLVASRDELLMGRVLYST